MTRICAAFATGSLCLSLAACGGGGGGNESEGSSASITLSIEQLSFSTTAPWDPAVTPGSVQLVGTVQGNVSGVVYIIIQVNNPELVSVGSISISGESGEARVTPADPTGLPIGRHTGSLVVRACANDPACNSNHLRGSPKTIPITYDIPSNIDGESVMPHVVSAESAGSVIIRGSGFPAGATVSFGTVAASAVNVVNSTEIRATYPALSAGTHPVAINSGAVAFNGNVAAIAPTDYEAVFLPHPVPTPAFVMSMDYDAERRALLVMLAGGADMQIMRYAYSGGTWSSPTFVTVPWLEQVRMSPDGSKLLALRAIESPQGQTVIEERDPVTLALQRSTTLAGRLGMGMAFTNDSQALVRMRGTHTRAYLFGLHSRSFRELPFSPDAFGVVASADGRSGAFLGGENWHYDPSTGKVRRELVGGSQIPGFDGNDPVADLTGARIQSGQGVLNEQLILLGLVPNPNPNLGGDFGTASMNRAGTRMYGAVPNGSGLPRLYTWDLTQAPVNGRFVQIGEAVELPGDHGAISGPAAEMIISPDGRTAFIGGFEGIVVMPAPAAQ